MRRLVLDRPHESSFDLQGTGRDHRHHLGGVLDHQPNDWAPHAWKWFWSKNSLPRPDIVDDLVERYFSERLISRLYLYSLASPLQIEELLIGTLAWRYGTDGNGRPRTQKTLTIQTEPPKTPFEVAAEIVRTAQTKGARAGFAALFDGNSGRLKNVGTAFGTKLLHFGAYKEVSGEARPLIYDKNVWKGWSREPGMSAVTDPDKCVSADYLAYCEWCEEVATAQSTTPAVVEYCLYWLGRAG
jgi:hypothetical protein